jgi:hypothetical protein
MDLPVTLTSGLPVEDAENEEPRYQPSRRQSKFILLLR